jgi:hypothetical protein
VALDHLVHRCDRFDKTADGGGILVGQPNACKQRYAITYRRGIDNRAVAFDYARIFEQFYAPKAGRWRQSYFSSKLDILDPPISLEGPKDTAIYIIELHWHRMP